MTYTSGLDKTGNVAANTHASTSTQQDGGTPSTIGEHAFREGAGAPPSPPLQLAQAKVRNTSHEGVDDTRTDTIGNDDGTTDRASSVISDESSDGGTVLIGYPGVHGTRGMTRVYTSTTHSRDTPNNDELFVGDMLKDAAPHVLMNILHDPGLVRGVMRLVFEMGFQGVKVDPNKTPGDLDSDKKMIVHQEHLDGTEQRGPSLADMLLSGILHLGEPEDVSSLMAHKLLDSHDEASAKARKEFLQYRERDFPPTGPNPLTIGEWHSQTRAQPAVFAEVVIPGGTTNVDDTTGGGATTTQTDGLNAPTAKKLGDDGYVKERVRVVNAESAAQADERAKREAKPGWTSTSPKDH